MNGTRVIALVFRILRMAQRVQRQRTRRRPPR